MLSGTCTRSSVLRPNEEHIAFPFRFQRLAKLFCKIEPVINLVSPRTCRFQTKHQHLLLLTTRPIYPSISSDAVTLAKIGKDSTKRITALTKQINHREQRFEKSFLQNIKIAVHPPRTTSENPSSTQKTQNCNAESRIHRNQPKIQADLER